MTYRWIAAASILFVVASVHRRVNGQTPERLSFEVASVKPMPRDSRLPPGYGGIVIPPGGGRLRAENVTVVSIIANAFRLSGAPLRLSQIVGGPDWIRSSAFEINATVTGMPRDELLQKAPAMLRTLLEDRFKLATHTETRQTPVYALVLARTDGKLGPQLRPSDVDCQTIERERLNTPSSAIRAAASNNGRIVCGATVGANRLTAGATSIGQVVSVASNAVDRPVVDRTGLTGRYDIDLEWSGGLADPAAGGAPSMFTALQEQLGLKLEPREEPREFLVIDRIEQPIPD